MPGKYTTHPLFKTIAGITTAGFLGLSMPQIVWSSGTEFKVLVESHGALVSSKTVGVNITGDLDFSNISINSFVYDPVDGLEGSNYSNAIFSVDNGVAKADLPLFTFGNNVEYVGVFYNQNGMQFYEHVVNAAEGDQVSKDMTWLYVAGGLFVVGGLAALAASGGDTKNTKETTVEPETTIPDADETPETPEATPEATPETTPEATPEATPVVE